ncbi:NUDIX hydrolase [Actinomadura fulvescens]|uniref:NUDIX hydrolase n=1 Tax=Actinomadura fulvescens TaxID=46160 RepID=UPI0031D25921
MALDEETGNALLAFLSAADVPEVPVSVALAAVWCGPHLLLVYDRFRQQWELPGGGIDPGEAPLQAAVRELYEESGLDLPALVLAGYARFWLSTPPRQEYAAVYTADVAERHDDFTPNEEIGAIRWWDATTPLPEEAQILDVTLARLVRDR